MRAGRLLTTAIFAAASLHCGNSGVYVTQTNVRWYVVKRIDLPTTAALDLDGRYTTADDSKISLNSCHRVTGSPTAVLADGPGGADDNFAARVLPILTAASPGFFDATNAAIGRGRRTILLRVDDRSVAFFVSGDLHAAPRFDGSDVYTVDAGSLVNGDLSTPRFVAGAPYVFGGAFSVPLTFTSSLADERIEATLPFEGGVVMFPDDRTTAFIGGAVRPENAMNTLGELLVAENLCATRNEMAAAAALSVDLVAGPPPYQDTTRDCDSISMQLALELAPIAPPTQTVATPSATFPNSPAFCP